MVMFEQERFIGRLQRHVLGELVIQSCFLTGSYGRRTEDAYSDVDVVLVYADAAARDVAWAGRREFVRAVMPYVSVRSFDDDLEPETHVALYSNGTKADYHFRSADNLPPAAGAREIRILKDKAGWAEAYQSASARRPLEAAYLGSEELRLIDDRFWVMLWDIARRLKRGDADRPFAAYLKLLDATLPPLLAVLPPEEPARQALIHTVYIRDAAATLRELMGLLDAYVAARSAVIRRANMSFQVNAGFETEIRRLLERLAR